MKRSLIGLCVIFLAVATLGAQGAPKRVLSPKDIDAFVANFETLSEDIEAIEERYPNLFSPEGTDVGDGSAEPDAFSVRDVSPVEDLRAMRATKVPDEVDAVFKKHGLGSNGFEKYIVIVSSVGVIGVLESHDGQRAAYAEYPEMIEYLSQVKTQMEAMKAEIDPADYALVESRKSELMPVFESLGEGDDMGSAEDMGSGEGDYGDYGYGNEEGLFGE